MATLLSRVDHAISKLGPVNAVITALSERLLSTETTAASGHYVDICGTTPCGRGGIYTGRYRCKHIHETGQNIDCQYIACNC